MRKETKVVSIANNLTAAQYQTALNNQLTKGWQLKFIVPAGALFMVIFERDLTR